MAATLNYLLEANLGLVLILAFYFVFLRNETNFTMMRIYLLGSILAAIVFPLIDLQFTESAAPLSIGSMIPSYWLPEVVVGGQASTEGTAAFNVWNYIGLLYIAGVVIGLSIVLFQLIQLRWLIRNAVAYQREGISIAESNDNKPTFSFFNFIFIGNAAALSPQEKEQIILHESVHAAQRHSLDVLLINTLKIFFWFNPFINIYKKIFIQLHEFEADARAVENRDVDKYCSLLARVALQSADYSMANHFNNSLTVKRIEMMRTIKYNTKRWKIVALIMSLPFLFFLVACQDHIEVEMAEITRNSSHALIAPQEVQQRYELLKKQNPQKNYVLLELNETAATKLEELKAKYGLPKAMELFKAIDGEILKESTVRMEHPSGIAYRSNATETQTGRTDLSEMTTSAGPPPAQFSYNAQSRQNGLQTFAIVEFDERASKLSEEVFQKDKVFTVVEEQPEFTGGYESMVTFLHSNLQYPSVARQQGTEGTVFVSFIVEKDGSISEIKALRGISPECDAEALRVVKTFPAWTPGKQKNEPVRVRFVLPIKFKL